ncbi:MAG: cytosine permease [Marinobacter sp.]|nr:cytosine permease [Marinobacter sp.]
MNSQTNKDELESHGDYALTAVPLNARRGFISMTAVMLGFTFFASSMWTGGTLGQNFSLWPDLLLVILGGNLLLGIYGSLLAYAASKTNLSTHVLLWHSFGVKGSKLPSFMLAITQIGWFGVGIAMLSAPITKYVGIPYVPLLLVGGLAMTYTVAVGFKAIELLSMIAVPAILILGFTSVFKAIFDAPEGIDTLLFSEPSGSMTIAVGMSLAVGSFISGATLTPDFVRFSKNKRIGVFSTAIGFVFGNSLMFIFGAVGAIATGVSDIAEVLALQGLLGAGIILLVLNIWTTNDNALYASGLGLVNITGLKRSHLVWAAGIFGTVASDFLYNNFIGWLSFLSVSLPPIGGIIIADFFFRARTNYPAVESFNPQKFNGVAIVAWLIAIAVSVASPEKGIFSVAPLNAIVATIVSYAILTAALEKVARRAVPKSAEA